MYTNRAVKIQTGRIIYVSHIRARDARVTADNATSLEGVGLRAQDLEFRVEGLGFRV
jgi:hypothetical protein